MIRYVYVTSIGLYWILTWYLTHDIWYPTLDMLSPDTGYLINTPDMWHSILYMLSLGTNTLDLMLWHLTGYYYTWHMYYIAYSWLSLLQGFDMIIILLPDIWYSWTLVLLYSWTPEIGRLLILYSWYYTHVDPQNWVTMDIGLLWTYCGHYQWTICNNWTAYTGTGETDGYRHSFRVYGGHTNVV